MRHTLQAQYPKYASKVQFYIGDVRNIESVRDVMYGADYVFHAAALKEVPSCEFFPMEAVKTNIIGNIGAADSYSRYQTWQHWCRGLLQKDYNVNFQ